jgi:predicted HD phosphohydrolase
VPVADTDLGNMHFDRLDDGTDEDFEVMRRVHGRNLAKLPDLLLSMLRNLKGDAAYPVDRLEHSVQTATRAMRAGADEEMIVCALLHTCARRWDRSTTARWARPFVSERNHWVLAHHAVFQTYFYACRLGLDPNARDQYKDSP